jgi:cation transport ATPase
VVTSGTAVVDEAALTGEALPVRRPSGDRARSGTVNAGDPFDLMATASAEESTYAGIVRLVQAAQAEKAPFVRLADRYVLLFVPLTLRLRVQPGSPRAIRCVRSRCSWWPRPAP